MFAPERDAGTLASRRALRAADPRAAVVRRAARRDALGQPARQGAATTDVRQVARARVRRRSSSVGLLAGALLVLVLAGQLLVARRSAVADRGPRARRVAARHGRRSSSRSRCWWRVAGATAAGLAVTGVLVGSPDWAAAVPVMVCRGPGGTGARRSAGGPRHRRPPGARQPGGPACGGAGTAGAAAGGGGGGGRGRGAHLRAPSARASAPSRAATSPPPAPTAWWTVAGALVLRRLLPPAVRLALRAARRGTGPVGLVVAARLARPGRLAFPLLVVAVAVAELVLTGALASTSQRGQEPGALLAVGGDARLDRRARPGTAGAGGRRRRAARRRGGRRRPGRGRRAALVGARGDGGAARRRRRPGATERLLRPAPAARTPPSWPGSLVARDGAVPALLLGGPSCRGEPPGGDWNDTDVPLTVVGDAPRTSRRPSTRCVVVDADAFAAAAGDGVDPDTVWAVGPGAAAALDRRWPTTTWATP